MTIKPVSKKRERPLNREAVEALRKPSGLKLLVTGAPRLGDLLFTFPAVNYLLQHESIQALTVLCFDYAAPILAGLSRPVNKLDLPTGSWNLIKRWRMLHWINQNNFDAAIVLDDKKSMRKLLASSKIPAILIESTTGLRKTEQHLQSVLSSFPPVESLQYPTSPIPTVQLPQGVLESARCKIASFARPRIAFHVGCQRVGRKGVSFDEVNRTATKLWQVERFLELGRMLIARLGAAILMIGSGQNERALAEQFAAQLGPGCVNAIGWGDALETAALLHHCDALVASDGGVLHLGMAVEVKTAAIWGPTPIELFGPIGPSERLKILRKKVDCSPCKRSECADKICLSSISAGEVFTALVELLNVNIL
jgi:ADP-heptose:LPS heptosyltransferase